MQVQSVGFKIKGYGKFVKAMQTLETITLNQIVQQRLEIIQFFDEYGAEATQKAYGYSRSTVYLWKKKLKEARGNPKALIPKSKRPLRVRRMETHPEVVLFIKQIREKYSLGKEKVKPLLDAYCEENGLPTISESTIGKVIQRNNFFFIKRGKMYHDPSRVPTKSKRARLPSGHKAKKPGSLVQIDTIVKFDYGIKRYILTAIDLYSRFSFALSYKKLSSRIGLHFYQCLETVTPFEVKAVKTDNGLEFLGEFDQYLKKQKVKHYFSYPRTPQSNAYIERFNRTLQEEFVEEHLELLKDTDQFNGKLIEYLIFYNTVRPHHSLKNLTPMGYLIAHNHLSNMSVTYTHN